jgi:hypothetical protein
LRYAKAKAEQDAKEAAERRKLRAACGVLYQNTADKKTTCRSRWMKKFCCMTSKSLLLSV